MTTDANGDMAPMMFTIEVERVPVQMTIIDATAVEDAVVEFAEALSWAVSRLLTSQWTTGGWIRPRRSW